MYFFFFQKKTAYEMRLSDWSSDVCSSDLLTRAVAARSESERTRRSFIPRSPFGQTKGSSRRRTFRSRPAPRRGGREGREGTIEEVMGLRGACGHERGRVKQRHETGGRKNIESATSRERVSHAR